MKHAKFAVILAIVAAALYALNVPFSGQFLQNVPPRMMAGLLYLGAGVGMGVLTLGRRLLRKPSRVPSLDRTDLPFTVMMILLDIAAPIFLMLGILHAPGATVSLLNNFEIVATSLIALLFFREKISPRLWLAIALVTVASVVLGLEGEGRVVFNRGSLYVIAACLCWGLENNCTRRLSNKNAEQIVLVKGIFSGLGSLIVAVLMKEGFPSLAIILGVMLLGFVSYGLSILCYIKAQSRLGAAKTAAFYAIAPFLGVGFCMFLGERPEGGFYVGLILMVVSTTLMIRDSLIGETQAK